MNAEWVLAKIDEFMVLLDRYRHPITEEAQKQADDEIKAMLPTMEKIAARVDPGRPHQWEGKYPMPQWSAGRDTAIRLRAIVASEAEVEANLGAAGPLLAASGLHRGVWGAAAVLWDDGHLREAVQGAATHVDLLLQAKLDRQDISGADLAMQAFKLDPLKPGERRLRFPGLIEGSEAYKSRHDGAKFFGAGVMLAIRNPTTHDLTQPDAQAALEYLAALSIFARWIDEAEVIQG